MYKYDVLGFIVDIIKSEFYFQYTVRKTLLDTFTFNRSRNHAGLLMIVSFLTLADWSIRHRLKVKVSSQVLRTVIYFTSLKLIDNF